MLYKHDVSAITFLVSTGYIADDETRPSTTAVDNHTHGGMAVFSLYLGETVSLL